MERTILHLAIDSFPIQAERLRCPKLTGRPLALPLDRDFYGGIGASIFERLAPFAPVVEPGGSAGIGAGSGRFFLDLTGVARSHPEARDRAVKAGRDVEASFRLHPTLGVAGNKLVSRVAAQVVAPDGDLLDVSTGSEASFLAPLPVAMLPAARDARAAARLDLLSLRLVREVQALSLAHLARAFGVEHADGVEGAAKRTFAEPLRGSAAIAAAAGELLARAVKRRVRVRRLRLSAWGIVAAGRQLWLWDAPVDSLESTIDLARARFGAEALVPAAWMLHGLAVRPSPRP